MQNYSSAIRPKGDSTLINIIVIPNTTRTGIKGFDPWRERIMVEVKEPPIQNRANREVVSFFSKLFNTDVKIVSGSKSRQKTLEVSIPADEVKEALYENK
jgi:uncharacterized protein (TIGR00251 family)